ncbi:MAG: hypothetical protein ACKOSQ_12245 [Planctomycetaceae bacterium]
MKIRSFLLVACIVVVPLIAMFSHRLPPGARAAVAGLVRDLAGSPAAHARAVAPQAAPPVTPPRPEAGPAAAAAPAVAPLVVPVAAAVPEAAAFGPLRALGAVALDCRPLDTRGWHVASCRVPIDGNGQLERVFRATGADAAAAADNLLRDVTAWRRGEVEPQPGTMRF